MVCLDWELKAQIKWTIFHFSNSGFNQKCPLVKSSGASVPGRALKIKAMHPSLPPQGFSLNISVSRTLQTPPVAEPIARPIKRAGVSRYGHSLASTTTFLWKRRRRLRGISLSQTPAKHLSPKADIVVAGSERNG